MSKVSPRHLERRAYVYVRQSSLAQVQHHRESTARQYDLRERAVALGWQPELVEVIDEDQGQSGRSSEGREGFQRLVSEVALGRVGAVLGLEVSRLARSCADWYRLLEVAALSATLIVDEDGVYDPNHYNDRLLLGLKGTLSEAELHFLKSRMMGGRRNKARRGALRIRLPTGYVWDDGIRLDPDERVQEAVRLFFRSFTRLGSAAAVARYFEDHEQPFPRRDGHGSAKVATTWGPLGISRAVEILRSPIYAGAYAYSRRSPHPENPEDPAAGGSILIRDAHPGYISFDEYQRNVARLVANRNMYGGMRNRGTAREGRSLIQGLALCGRCGRHMLVSYLPDGTPFYSCRTSRTLRPCQAINGRHVDPLVEKAVLEALRPRELKLAVGALEKLAERASELDRQWQHRLEAARYETEKAARRYHQVEPENRLVARTLEREWNTRLEEFDHLEREYESAKKKPPFELTEAQRTKIVSLAQDLPRLWRAPTTKMSQRKEVVRLLVEDVTLRAVDDPWSIDVAIQWKTSVVTRHQARRVMLRPHKTDSATAQRLASLSMEPGRTDAEIAAMLNAERQRTGKGKRFTAGRVADARKRYGRRRRTQKTDAAVVGRIGEMFEQKTDAEIAQTLDDEGYRPAAARSFTAKTVFHLRRTRGLRKSGPRGLPTREGETTSEVGARGRRRARKP
jgi:DNA invertase Pin-like site-specific DNA recombinase